MEHGHGGVWKTALVSRIAVLLMQVVFNYFIKDYDSSSDYRTLTNVRYEHFQVTQSQDTRCNSSFNVSAITNTTLTDHLIIWSLNGFGNWDSVYFLHIAQFGYEYEQMMAFFPLFPLTVHIVAQVIHIMSFGNIGLYAGIKLSSWAINTVLFISATELLWRLTRNVTGNQKFATVVSILFCFNPASVFNSSSYSETIFVFSQFGAMNFLTSTDKNKTISLVCIKSCLFMALGSAARSNGMLTLGFLLFYIVKVSLNSLITEKYYMQFTKIAWMLTIIFISVALASLPFVMYQLYGAHLYCLGNGVNLHLQQKDHWCSHYLPMSYSYIQKHYWGVGPFRYYTVEQIPNFLLALPICLLVFGSIKSFLLEKRNWKTVISLGLNPEYKSNKLIDWEANFKFNANVFVFICHVAFLILFGLVNIHVQVLTRLLCSSSPVPYWYAATFFEPIHQTKSGSNARSYPVLKNCILGYFICYNLLGILSHCNFYPWT